MVASGAHRACPPPATRGARMTATEASGCRAVLPRFTVTRPSAPPGRYRPSLRREGPRNQGGASVPACPRHSLLLAAPDPQVDQLDEHREGHCRVDVALG